MALNIWLVVCLPGLTGLDLLILAHTLVSHPVTAVIALLAMIFRCSQTCGRSRVCGVMHASILRQSTGDHVYMDSFCATSRLVAMYAVQLKCSHAGGLSGQVPDICHAAQELQMQACPWQPLCRTMAGMPTS